MFQKDNLSKLSQADGFTVWVYDAGGNRQVAEGMRNQVGAFPNGSVKPGDAVYVLGGGVTTHHFVSHNEHEDKLSLCLFGG